MAKIYFLIKCTGCKKRIKENDNYTVWEKEHYCEPCFDEYLEMINPSDFLDPLESSMQADKDKRGE